ncbi:MAG: hypothetical protein IKC79_01585, partial [Clostridia bacterium]|nr:hypothetical protein [Clostridia bacterium]
MVADSHNDIFWIYQTKSELNTHLKQLSTNNVNKLACVYFSYNYSRDSDYILTDICDKFRWISD